MHAGKKYSGVLPLLASKTREFYHYAYGPCCFNFFELCSTQINLFNNSNYGPCPGQFGYLTLRKSIDLEQHQCVVGQVIFHLASSFVSLIEHYVLCVFAIIFLLFLDRRIIMIICLIISLSVLINYALMALRVTKNHSFVSNYFIVGSISFFLIISFFPKHLFKFFSDSCTYLFFLESWNYLNLFPKVALIYIFMKAALI